MPTTERTAPRGQVAAGLLGLGFVAAAWIVPVVTMWSGLVWGMPPEFGGLGWDWPGSYAGVAGVGLILGGLVLVILHKGLRAVRVHRPLVTLLAGGALTLALGAACLMLLALALPAGDAAGVVACTLAFLTGFGSFAGAARVL